jgi:DNA-directed RNA polymerase specialized sigma24 family protein
VRYASGALQTALFPNLNLAEFYRFALLLTGEIKVAERIMAETLSEVEQQLGEFRTETNRQAWLASHIRQRCLKENAGNPQPIPRLLRPGAEEEPGRPAILKIEAFILAQRFSTLPEPGRSALALFYLDLFSPEEIAKLLRVRNDELADLLGAARHHLQEAMRGGA